MVLLEAYPNTLLTDFRESIVPKVVESLKYFGPEFQVAVFAILILLLDLFISRRASKQLAWLAVAGLLYPTISVLSLPEGEGSIFHGMLSVDSYANFFKLFFLLGGIPVVMLSYVAKELDDHRMGEYYAILLSSVLAGMLMASSTHMLMAILSLELLSICSYVLVGFHRRQRQSAEASLKYIIYGSVAAAVMIYGLSLLYGLTGTGNLPEAAEKSAAILAQDSGALGPRKLAVIAGLLMTFLGLAYKMATIPMHFWCPDVYEGAPTPITAFLSVASKAAGFALCLRFFSTLSQATEASHWLIAMIVIAIATMTLGNFAALWQENVKRLFAYSSIAHAGYMMMGVVLLKSQGAGDDYTGVQLIAYYLLAYLAMNLGAFVVVVLIENRTGSVRIGDYNGLGWRAPLLGAGLCVSLFSLIGIPPTAGFTGKFQLLLGVIQRAQSAGGKLGVLYYALAIAAVVNTAVSVYYYAKIIRNMYLVRIDEDEERIRVPILGALLVIGLVFLTFYLFFDADWVLNRTLDLELGGHHEVGFHG
jgi:NADH-quinone oxidoreductase subunit N